MKKLPNHPNWDPKKSRAYDQDYVPWKSLEQLCAEFPNSQFLADRLAEEQEARREWEAEERARQIARATSRFVP